MKGPPAILGSFTDCAWTWGAATYDCMIRRWRLRTIIAQGAGEIRCGHAYQPATSGSATTSPRRICRSYDIRIVQAQADTLAAFGDHARRGQRNLIDRRARIAHEAVLDSLQTLAQDRDTPGPEKLGVIDQPDQEAVRYFGDVEAQVELGCVLRAHELRDPRIGGLIEGGDVINLNIEQRKAIGRRS